jgi:hypothetical protein
MSNKQNNLIWGVVLFILGGLFLVENLGLIPDFSQAMWMKSSSCTTIRKTGGRFFPVGQRPHLR